MAGDSSRDGRGDPDATSLSLLEQVRARDQQAWQRLMHLYAPLVHAWCRRRGLSDADAEDVVQEVFASVAAELDQFRRDRPGDTFRGWLRTITLRKIIDDYRQKKKQPQAAGGSTAHHRLEQWPDEQPSGEEPAGDAACDDAEVSGLFGRALDLIQAEFEPRTWEAFRQIVVQGRATADVAADLDMSAGAVRQAKYKVLRKLRLELGELLEWPEVIAQRDQPAP